MGWYYCFFLLTINIATVDDDECMVGYLFTFFWWLDLISILSLFPDVFIVAKPMGIAKVMTAYV